ncbi:hypothetical protein SAMN05444714_2306 [Yoonia litorea]|uniref:Uncharacterized protein n=1 Tax=Yoonia litorea TaxID=1123755 RepID=A0A1I6MVD8_9RHOB|nr:hypothetical protein SAMN05444714_2306 [Yoonia litorea]
MNSGRRNRPFTGIFRKNYKDFCKIRVMVSRWLNETTLR